MHLHTILAFAYLFWRLDQPLVWRPIDPDDVWLTMVIALGQVPVWGLASALISRHARRLAAKHPTSTQATHQFHHRAIFVLRLAMVLGFGVTVLLTNWPNWFELRSISPALQLFGNLIVLSPFFGSAVALWAGSYTLERDLHHRRLTLVEPSEAGDEEPWPLWAYLDFNLRHHLLILAVPMMIVLFGFDLTQGYETALKEWTGWAWTPDVLLGLLALVVFITAPLMLKRIWHTHPLEPGPLRQRLETVCGTVGLRFRDILVWKSDGMMINAAVMGVCAPVRYILLSDGLLDTMSMRQIEAVFGHEAGHVRHRHIQHFLLFAYVGWVIVAGLMELLLQMGDVESGRRGLSIVAVQGAGVMATVLFWGLGFGWISRRFERQADVFGAFCAAPDKDECEYPCSVHLGEGEVQHGSVRVCATGATVFADALDRVALLNGIPHEERSWRHSSIGSRIRFLSALAGDPNLAERFDRVVKRTRTALLAAAVLGSAAAMYYYVVAEPELTKWATGGS